VPCIVCGRPSSGVALSAVHCAENYVRLCPGDVPQHLVKLGGHAPARVHRERQYLLAGTAGVLLLLVRDQFVDGMIEVAVISVGLVVSVYDVASMIDGKNRASRAPRFPRHFDRAPGARVRPP